MTQNNTSQWHVQIDMYAAKRPKYTMLEISISYMLLFIIDFLFK